MTPEEAPVIQIGSNPACIYAVGKCITSILEFKKSDGVILKALDVFSSTCKVDHTTIAHCNVHVDRRRFRNNRAMNEPDL